MQVSVAEGEFVSTREDAWLWEDEEATTLLRQSFPSYRQGLNSPASLCSIDLWFNIVIDTQLDLCTAHYGETLIVQAAA